MLSLFDELNLSCSILLNAYAAVEYPPIVARVMARGDEVVAHGRINAERRGDKWEQDELRDIEETSDTLTRASAGMRPTGWMSPDREEGPRTLDLLQRAGYEYVLDCPMDDQPICLKTVNGSILSVPYPLELNDLPCQVKRGYSAFTFARMIEAQFDEMMRQTQSEPLLMGISLPTFISG